jgi:ankyrin repeat protein
MDDMDDWLDRGRLHRAAEAGDVPLVQDLLDSGCPVNAFDELGKTPLHYAVLGEHLAVVDCLLRRGADINARDERVIGDTPLGEAASTCTLRMARHLVEAGADPTVRGWMQLNAVDRAERRAKSEGAGGEGQAVYELLCEVAGRHRPRR